MGQGKKVSVYINKDALTYYDALKKLSEGAGRNISDRLSMAAVDACYQDQYGVRISEGAYACMKLGLMDKLVRFPLDNGTIMIVCSEDCRNPGIPEFVELTLKALEQRGNTL